MKFVLTLAMTLLLAELSAQEVRLPLELNNYSRATSYKELCDFIMNLDEGSDLIKAEKIGTSVAGRDLYGMKFSSSEFGKDPSKIKILIIAQQQGRGSSACRCSSKT